jgi:hypothetical protein
MARHRLNRGLSLAAAVAVAALVAPGGASANTITVGSTDDPSGGGDCSLRNAIAEAVVTGSGAGDGCAPGDPSPAVVDTVDFNLPNPSTIMLNSAIQPILDDVNIVGPGIGALTVDGANAVRPFSIPDGSVAVSISGLTISHGLCGNACFGSGGAILNSGDMTLTNVAVTNSRASRSGGTDTFPEGGGIRNDGTLHLIGSTVSGNSALASGASNQNAPAGGGIWSNGTVTLDHSTVSGNNITAVGSGGSSSTSAFGGGVVNAGQLTVTRSTISQNAASATAGGMSNSASGAGVGVSNAIGIVTSLDRATVSANLASAGNPSPSADSGGILAAGGSGSFFTVSSSTISGNSSAFNANVQIGGETVSFKNTIVSNPLGGGENCGGAASGSLGFNLEDTDTCGFGQATDKPNTDPLLAAAPADNGGPTQTMALLTGSPAIDAGLSSTGETADQRGLARPLDLIAASNAAGSDGTDIGAFEVQGPAVPPPAAVTPTITPPTTVRKKCKKHKKHRAAAAKKKCKKKKK